ncbi:IclR family transcriptional regulator [Rubrobacter naiadicus]|uniref:IclR family transcriptional regulator n=1 Tax=Rubrobacter naiadicus TaxID=1392641 RepID=UPI002360C991|nr:IclR family transcriptional regulator [Rubrobacter naiadicus]
MAVRSSRSGEVQSLARALDILELLGRAEGELGVTEIGPAVGLPNGTAHRLLATLTRRGYARQVGESRKYTLGPKALVLASAAREHLGTLARPFLRELMEVSQETSNLAVLDRNSVVYIDQVPARRMVRMFTEPGNRVPPHATGTGKVLLAYQPEEAVEAILRQSGLPRFTAHTVTDPERLRAELGKIREQGYAVDSEEMEEGVRCLAAPVFGPDDRILAAMSVSGPAGRLSSERVQELVPHIKRICAAFSASISSDN